MKNANPTRLEKNIKFMSEQGNIIKLFSSKCTDETLIEIIKFNNTEIKHFKLQNNLHVYSLKGEQPKRLISNVELPNITYFTEHWNPMLLPDSDLSNVTGSFIYVNPNSVSYSSFLNGKILINSGYTFHNDNPKHTQFFYNFREYGISGLLTRNVEKRALSEVPKNVYTILGFIKEQSTRNNINNLKIKNGIKALSDLESRLHQPEETFRDYYSDNSQKELPKNKSSLLGLLKKIPDRIASSVKTRHSVTSDVDLGNEHTR